MTALCGSIKSVYSSCNIFRLPNERSQGWRAMQRIDPYAFYNLGTQIHALEDIKKEQTLRDVVFVLWQAREAIDTIINNRIIDLDICKPACTKLRGAIADFIPEDLSTISKEKHEKNLGEFSVWWVQKCLKEFETVIAAELNAAGVYFVSQKEAYNTSDLIESAEKIFPDAIRTTFSDQTLHDVRQAGRCLAFNLPTAAGFHITRALENVVLEASKKFDATKPQKDDLYSYIRVLESNGIDKDVLYELDGLREKYRNQLMHPEIFLSDIEISVLISDVKNVMVRLHQEMEKTNRAPVVALAAPSPPSGAA